MRFLLGLVVGTIAVLVVTHVLPGVYIESILAAVVVAVALGIVNTFIRPLLLILTLPLTVITFGLFAFVINALLVWFVAWIVPGFSVDNFWWALLFSILISIVSSFLNLLAGEK